MVTTPVPQAVLGPRGLCLDSTDTSHLTLAPCDGEDAQRFAYDADTGAISTAAPAETARHNSANILEEFAEKANERCVDVYDFDGPVRILRTTM